MTGLAYLKLIDVIYLYIDAPGIAIEVTANYPRDGRALARAIVDFMIEAFAVASLLLFILQNVAGVLDVISTAEYAATIRYVQLVITVLTGLAIALAKGPIPYLLRQKEEVYRYAPSP